MQRIPPSRCIFQLTERVNCSHSPSGRKLQVTKEAVAPRRSRRHGHAFRQPPLLRTVLLRRLLHGSRLYARAIGEVDRRCTDDEIALLQPLVHLHRGAEIVHEVDPPHPHHAVLEHRDVQSIAVEHHRVRRQYDEVILARDLQLDGTVAAGPQDTVGIWHVDLREQRPRLRLQHRRRASRCRGT